MSRKLIREISLDGKGPEPQLPYGPRPNLEILDGQDLKPVPIPIGEDSQVSALSVEFGKRDEVSQLERETVDYARRRYNIHIPDVPGDVAGFFWNYYQETGEGALRRRVESVLLDLEGFEIYFEELYKMGLVGGTTGCPRFYLDRPVLRYPISEKVFSEVTERVEKTKTEILRLAKLFNRRVTRLMQKGLDQEKAYISTFDWLSRKIFSQTKYEKGKNRLVDIFSPKAGEPSAADCEGRAKAIIAVLDRVDLNLIDEEGRVLSRFDVEWEFFRDHVRVVVGNRASKSFFVLEDGVNPLTEERKTVRFPVGDVLRYFTGETRSLPFPKEETNELPKAEEEVEKTSTVSVDSSPSLEHYHHTPEEAVAAEQAELGKKEYVRLTARKSEEEFFQELGFSRETGQKLAAGIEEIKTVVFRKAVKEGKRFWESLPHVRRNLIKDLAFIGMLTSAGAACVEFSDRLGRLEVLSGTIVDTAEEISKDIKVSKTDPDLSVNFVSELDRRWQEEWVTHFDGTDYLMRSGSDDGGSSVLTTSVLESGTVCDEINITPEVSERIISGSFWKALAREASRESGEDGYEVEKTVNFTSPNKHTPLSVENIIGQKGDALREAFDEVRTDGFELPEGSIRVILDGKELVEVEFGE